MQRPDTGSFLRPWPLTPCACYRLLNPCKFSGVWAHRSAGLAEKGPANRPSDDLRKQPHPPYARLRWSFCCRYLVAKSCPALCDLVDCSPPGSSIHGVLQARMLERVAISFSRGSPRPRDQTQVSCTSGRFLTTEPPRKPLRWRGVSNA